MLDYRPARGRLHVRDDEEPDWDESHLVPSDVYFAAIKGLCNFCGHPFGRYGHPGRSSRCPYRPMDQ